jgi:spore germination protein GerM
MEDNAVPLDAAQLPSESVPAEPGATADERAFVYLVSGERLQAVPRPAQPSLRAVVEVLLEGPRETEAETGLRSAVPAGTALLGMTDDNGVIRVDLSAEFKGVIGEEHLLALAQLVYTVAGASSADLVAISIEGVSVPVARDDGEITDDPVGPGDYDELAPP